MKRRFQAITPLVDAYRGRAAIIVGGGPSLPTHLATPGLPADAVIIGANDHVMRTALRPDYIVAIDPIESRMRAHGVPLISPRRWADIRLFGEPVSSSSGIACWAAWILGCAPIILAGMDCFQVPEGVDTDRPPTYFHNANAASSGHGQTLASHLNRWRKQLEICPGARICTLGGPTEQVFRKYPETTVVDGPVMPTKDKVDLVGGVVVRFTMRPFTEIGRVRFRPGEIWEVSRHEANQAIRQRQAVRTERTLHA